MTSLLKPPAPKDPPLVSLFAGPRCTNVQLFENSPPGLVNSVAFDTNDPSTLYAGTDQGAFISFDGGTTWGEINDGLLGATVVYSIAVDKERNVYAATPYGVFKLEGK